ncbi:MAG: carbohydrate ABC transporter substrate-binding protein [Erysipelothrix sp.]|nr:carbohydrate ABC transporter substrate-binding protein [Erysipelothrix sp.]
MKKLLAILLVGLLVLTGCSTKKDEPETLSGNLTIYGLEGGYGKAGWEAVVEEFEKLYDIEVELVLEKNIGEILRPKVQADEAPDLVYLAVGSTDGFTDTMVAEEAILNIEDLLDMTVPGEDVKVKDKVLPGFLDSNRVRPYEDGELYLTPHFYSPLGMFYNKGLFEAKDWKIPATWDEMFALGDIAKEEGIALFTYPTTGYFDGFFASLLNAVVGTDHYNKLMNYDLDAWKDAKTKKAFEIVGKLAEYTHENTVAQANSEGFQKNQQLVMENKALFVPNGTWLPGEMAEAKAPSADGFAWGLAPVPAIKEGGDRYSSTFTEEVYIPAGAKNVDNAKAFLAFLYSDIAADKFYNVSDSPAVQPIVGSDKLIPKGDDNEIYYNIYANGAKSNTVGFVAKSVVPGYKIEDILYETVNAVVNGDKTVDAWYDEVIEAIGKYN